MCSIKVNIINRVVEIYIINIVENYFFFLWNIKCILEIINEYKELVIVV